MDNNQMVDPLNISDEEHHAHVREAREALEAYWQRWFVDNLKGFYGIDLDEIAPQHEETR